MYQFLIIAYLFTLGNLKYVRARTPEGKLTNFMTGDRFVDIVVPDDTGGAFKKASAQLDACWDQNCTVER